MHRFGHDHPDGVVPGQRPVGSQPSTMIHAEYDHRPRRRRPPFLGYDEPQITARAGRMNPDVVSGAGCVHATSTEARANRPMIEAGLLLATKPPMFR